MKLRYGNLLTEARTDAVAITTNGFVTSKGQAVMGRGIALAVADKIPEVKQTLANLINTKGNRVHELMRQQCNKPALVSFPVKPDKIKANADGSNIVTHARNKYKKNDTVAGFHAVADLALIGRSARQLVKLADSLKWESIAIPRTGCGAGELDWGDVKPVLAGLLDHRFEVWTFKRDEQEKPHVVALISFPKDNVHEIFHSIDELVDNHNDIEFITMEYSEGLRWQEYFKLRKWSNLTICHMKQKVQINLGFKTFKIKPRVSGSIKNTDEYTKIELNFMAKYANTLVIDKRKENLLSYKNKVRSNILYTT